MGVRMTNPLTRPIALNISMFPFTLDNGQRPGAFFRSRVYPGVQRRIYFKLWQSDEEMYRDFLDLLAFRNRWFYENDQTMYRLVSGESVVTFDRFMAYMCKYLNGAPRPQPPVREQEVVVYHPSVVKAQADVATVLARYGVGT